MVEKINAFTGTHPAKMVENVRNENYEFDPTKIEELDGR